MDKNAIKRYAVWARRELMARVSQKARQYGITAEETVDAGADIVNGRVLSGEEKSRRRELVREVKSKGYEQTIEEAAYTWFNRFIALRFMEVNGCLPTHVRVFTDDEGRFAPQILTEAIDVELEGLDRERVYALKSADRTEELYQYLLITQCNALNAVLPGMFRSIDSYMELLFPDNLLREGSVVERMISMIPQEDWRDQVQIIGWLYQYYNTEPKDKVFADLKKNIKVSREKIPAATQLFTPDWIVRYMVENSLGRLWVEGHPNEELKAGWRYYLEEAKQEPEVQAQLEQLRAEYRDLKPEEIKCIDPCMGSGHILVYMFDVLMQIYESCGWSQRDAVRSILEHNLYGLDIDDRAAQLAYFSVMMKAVSYDSRFLRRGDIPQPNVYSPRGYGEGEELGSLLAVDDLEPRPEQEGELTLFDERYEDRLARWNFRRLLAQKYHVVVTNPPYMGASNMNSLLSEYVKINFPDEKADMFACFMERGNRMVKPNGYNSMVTMQSWMFLSSFEKMRKNILKSCDITNLMHMENMVMGIAFGTAVTVLRNNHVDNYKGTYNHIKLADIQDDEPKAFPVPGNRFAQVSTANFSKIPGSPVAYWVSKNALLAYINGVCLAEFAKPKAGLATGDNDLFERYWFEVLWTAIGFGYTSTKDTITSKHRWFPCNSGGEFRKWSFNDEIVVNWYNDGQAIKTLRNSSGKLAARPQNTQFYFKRGLTWNKLSSSRFAVKYKESGSIYDDTSRSIFLENEENLFYLLGLLCSAVTFDYLKALNPTMSFTNGDIERIPYLYSEKWKEKIDEIVRQNISISKNDWDSFETSWDFKKHPLI